MAQNKFRGLGIALITPFKADGSIDTDALIRLVEYQITSGADFLCIMGTTAEKTSAYTYTPSGKLTCEGQQRVEVTYAGQKARFYIAVHPKRELQEFVKNNSNLLD